MLQQQADRGWGAKVIDRLAADLSTEFPDMHGWSRTNLYAMRSMAEAWPDPAIVPTLLGRIPWSHIRLLISKVPDPAMRDWYARQAGEQGWTLRVLQHQVATEYHLRAAAAPSSFEQHLELADADQAQALTKDPY